MIRPVILDLKLVPVTLIAEAAMLDIEKALEYIEFEGTDLDRYRCRFLFRGQRDDVMATWLFGSYQNSDGGYPLHLLYGEPSNISETAKMLGYASELGISRSHVCDQAVEFLKAHQHPLGFWQESSSQLELGEELGGEWGRLWLSAYTGRALSTAGLRELAETKKVRNYFLALRVNGNQFTTSPAIHFLALGFFALLEGAQCGIVKEALPYALANFTRSKEPRLICVQAQCLLDAGVRPDHEVLKDAKRRLVRLEEHDGGWGEHYEGLRVRTTIDVLVLLLKLGAWKLVEEN